MSRLELCQRWKYHFRFGDCEFEGHAVTSNHPDCRVVQSYPEFGSQPPLDERDMPDRFIELQGLHRWSHIPASRQLVTEAAKVVMCVAVVLAHGAPILVICSRSHARLWHGYLARVCGLDVVTLRKGWEHYWSGSQGGSADEHILRFDKKELRLQHE